MTNAVPARPRIDEVRRLAVAKTPGTEPAHDIHHVLRVAANAERIAAAEGAEVAIAVAAALLHELFNYPKGHPESKRSGEVCADQAESVLRDLGWHGSEVERVGYAIRVHPFSLGVVPTSLEAKVLQDADRLDAIGAIGIARCFATCADMKRPFYAPADPFCTKREPEDKLWGVDHFYRKLLKLEVGMHTPHARAMAKRRVDFMTRYLEELAFEVASV